MEVITLLRKIKTSLWQSSTQRSFKHSLYVTSQLLGSSFGLMDQLFVITPSLDIVKMSITFNTNPDKCHRQQKEAKLWQNKSISCSLSFNFSICLLTFLLITDLFPSLALVSFCFGQINHNYNGNKALFNLYRWFVLMFLWWLFMQQCSKVVYFWKYRWNTF